MKKLIGGTDQLHNLAPFQYGWAWDMTQKSISNHWTKHETPMGADKACYEQRLNDSERHMFYTVLATLTTSDIAVLKNIAVAIFERVTAPEVQAYLARQIAEEVIHSDTYQHCYSEDTEILTSDGWKFFYELDEGDLVAQYTDTGNIEFVCPSSYISRNHQGKMVLFSSAKYDLLVTEDHRMVGYLPNKNGGHLRILNAKDFSTLSIPKLPVAGVLSGHKKRLSWFDRLRIAYQADGSIDNPRTKEPGKISGTLGYRFTLRRKEKIDRLIKILNNIGYEYNLSTYEGTKNTIIRFRLPKEYALHKDFDWVDLESVDSSYFDEVLEELRHWDGWLCSNGSIGYSSTDFSCAEKVITFSHLCGRRVGVTVVDDNPNWKPRYQLRIIKKGHIDGKSVSKEWVDYDGMVYCVSVPSGMLMVRRNGKISISGNCLEVIGLPQEDVYSLYERVPAIKQKFDLAAHYSQQIADFESLEKFTEGLIFYYLCFEGGWFYNGFSPIFSLQRRNFMTGTGEQLQYIARDESMHTAFGVRLIREIVKENNLKLNRKRVEDIIGYAVSAEQQYAYHAIPDVLGYNAKMHTQQLTHLMDRRLRQIGLEPLYHQESVVPWLDEQVSMMKEKNFFETRVTEYQSGGSLNFENTNMNEVLNWK